MTLILERVSVQFVMQVTDRLVTLQHNYQPYDTEANKNIIYITSNAIITLAYTGDAYIGNIPTDYWIAQQFADSEFDFKSPPLMSTYGNRKLPDIGMTLKNLVNSMNQRPSIRSLVLSIVGWQWNKKGRLRPIISTVSKSNGIFQLKFEPRDWFTNGFPVTIAAPYNNISQDELEKISISLRNKPPSKAKSILVNNIRKFSKKYPFIGSDCVSILIPPPSNPNISISFHKSYRKNSNKSEGSDESIINWAYSPWIISPQLCCPPAKIVGSGFTIKTSFFKIHFYGNKQKHPLFIFANEGLIRKGQPTIRINK